MNDLLERIIPKSVPLGQKSFYPDEYDPKLLHPIKRSLQRDAQGFLKDLPFLGYDIWNAHEIYYLNEKQKPIRAILSIKIPALSENLIESKSLKLYLNSINNKIFKNKEEFLNIIKNDLKETVKSNIELYYNSFDNFDNNNFLCLDELDIENAKLEIKNEHIKEKLCTHLFKSHCLVTGQPDFASIFIDYEGPKISHEGLLNYLISFKHTKGFSENLIEQIFMDLYNLVKPKSLWIMGRFTIRGGLDINPVRMSKN